MYYFFLKICSVINLKRFLISFFNCFEFLSEIKVVEWGNLDYENVRV